MSVIQVADAVDALLTYFQKLFTPADDIINIFLPEAVVDGLILSFIF
jgi:hypothetical protein